MSAAVALAPALRARLAAVWHDAGRPTLRIDPDALASVAKELRSKVPELVLAILVAEGRSLGQLVTLTSDVVAFYEASEVPGWRRATKFDHVAFAELTAPGSAAPVYACFARTSDSARAELVSRDLRKPGEGGAPLSDLDAYLQRRAQLSGREPGAVSDDAVAAFQPVVAAAPTAAPTVVRHPKFGEGKLLERIDGGKLRIDFGAAGVKVLAASFVEIPPDER